MLPQHPNQRGALRVAGAVARRSGEASHAPALPQAPCRATPERARAALDAPSLVRFTTLEPGHKRLLFAVLKWPTDSESYITVLAWSYTRHFDEWRLVLHQEVYGALDVTPVHDPKRAAVVLQARDPQHPEALVLPLSHVPYSTDD